MKESENNEYHIWVHGSRHPQYLPIDQLHSLGSYCRRGKLAGDNYQYKGYFGNYSMVDPKPSKINFFYWGTKKNERDGRLSANARKEAGKALFAILKKIAGEKNENYKFNLYGFSHGGSVIAECIEEIKSQKSSIFLNKIYFLDTPLTESTEKPIHMKNNGKYIAEKVYNVVPEKRKGLPLHLLDWTVSFPCCANSFLFKRDKLYNISFKINSNEVMSHSDFGLENIFLENVSEKVTKINILLAQGQIQNTCSKNPFRWMLYYRKYIYLALLIAAIAKYVKERKHKYEFRIVMR